MSPKSDNAIIEAFKQETREHGIGKVTMGSIAKRCNCARQTIYYHYDNVSCLIREVVSNDGRYTDSEYDSAWGKNADRVLKNLKNNEDIILDIESSKYQSDLHRHVMNYCHDRIVNELVSSCADRGSAQSRATIGQIITYCIGGYIVDWIAQGLKESTNEIMAELNRLCGAAMHRMIEDYLMLRPNDSKNVPRAEIVSVGKGGCIPENCFTSYRGMSTRPRTDPRARLCRA